MKRFFVYCGDNFYPGGGWDDFLKDVDTIKGGRRLVECVESGDWAQIVDTVTGELETWVHAETRDESGTLVSREWVKR